MMRDALDPSHVVTVSEKISMMDDRFFFMGAGYYRSVYAGL